MLRIGTMITHLIRLGFAGDVFRAGFEASLPRGRRVLVRTPRGVELADVLATLGDADDGIPPALSVVRPTTPADEALLERLTRHKVRAVRRCQEILSQTRSPARLLDVDQLLDGGTLILHFLGDVDALTRESTDEVVRAYESEVQTERLADLMTTGCGEGCGTSAATAGGCGDGGGGGCAGCAVGCGTTVSRTTVSRTTGRG